MCVQNLNLYNNIIETPEQLLLQQKEYFLFYFIESFLSQQNQYTDSAVTIE